MDILTDDDNATTMQRLNSLQEAIENYDVLGMEQIMEIITVISVLNDDPLARNTPEVEAKVEEISMLIEKKLEEQGDV